MFQYAYGSYLAHKYDYPLFFDKSIYQRKLSIRDFALDIYDIEAGDIMDATKDLSIAEKEIVLIQEEHFHFSEAALEPISSDEDKSNMILVVSGYWQSEKYFSSIENIIRLKFKFTNGLTDRWVEMKAYISSVNSVMVHVRRGDYLQLLDFHGVIDTDYIQRGVQYIDQKLDNRVLFVFSDDMAWCKENIVGYENIVFVGEEYYESTGSKLHLMQSCKHFIISNSTFAWWAAWLSDNKAKIVIAPSKWFATDTLDPKDLIPEGWIKM